MNKLIPTLLLCLWVSQLGAQCGNDRYYDRSFAVDSVFKVFYGTALNQSGRTDSLFVDLYLPKNDTMAQRPLIILAHGGSFIGGDRTSPEVTTFCYRLAQRGYACASLSYRLGINALNFNNVEMVKAATRATQDMRGAVRFFYESARDKGNPYKIDTLNIVLGGSSAGAITALHSGFLKRHAQFQEFYDTTSVIALGGLDGGNSAAPGYPTKVAGVINLCGAIGRVSWIEPASPFVISMHGNVDGTVNYKTGQPQPGLGAFTAGLLLDGSYVIDTAARNRGERTTLFTYWGQDHVPYVNGSAPEKYTDTTDWYLRDWLNVFMHGRPEPLTVTVSATANSLGDSLALCAGESLTLSVPGSASNFVWSTGATTPSITVNQPGLYSVTHINACDSTPSYTYKVVAMPVPTITSGPNPTSALRASQFSGASYQWLDGQGNAVSGATNATYLPTVNGDYSVRITYPSGCVMTSAATYWGGVGIDPVWQQLAPVAYPNPADNQLNVRLANAPKAGWQAQLLDAMGRTVAAQSSTTNEMSFARNHLAAGIYRLKLVAEGSVLTLPIVLR